MVITHHPRKGYWQCCGGWQQNEEYGTIYANRVDALNVAAFRGLSGIKVLTPTPERIANLTTATLRKLGV